MSGTKGRTKKKAAIGRRASVKDLPARKAARVKGGAINDSIKQTIQVISQTSSTAVNNFGRS